MNRFEFSNERGQGFTEYALLLTAVALTAVATLSLLGMRISDVICQAAEGIGAEAICGDLHFADDFSQGLDKWRSLYGQDKHWTITDGDNPQLCHTGGGGDILLANDSKGSDYTIKTNANLPSSHGHGVFFRSSENEKGRIEGYTFQYDPSHGGQFIMRKWVNGYELHPPFATAKAPAGFNWRNANRQIEIDAIGGVFTAKVDGAEVLVGKDDSYSEGGVGLRVGNGGKACFDNFSVQNH